MVDVQEESFFEGTEKLLEVWFSSSEHGNDVGDLRSVNRTQWDQLLKNVKCEIISHSHNNEMDAYVLSESSMFITSRRFILKTCGITTLLHAVEPLLALVKDECGLDLVTDVFYSRKKFAKPEKQHHIHQSFEDEVDHLDKLFENGAAYTLGRMNRDCWYLYTIDAVGVLEPDQTVELLMWKMDPDKMKIFMKDVSKTSVQAANPGVDPTTVRVSGNKPVNLEWTLYPLRYRSGLKMYDQGDNLSGISDLIPDMAIDHYLFDPCGYSMNGLLPQGYYITIHVTPEPQCSYVSFESNVPQENYHDLISSVLKIFNPGEFLMTIFANKASIARKMQKLMENTEVIEGGYIRRDHHFCKFKNYDLTYTYYTRPVK